MARSKGIFSSKNVYVITHILNYKIQNQSSFRSHQHVLSFLIKVSSFYSLFHNKMVKLRQPQHWPELVCDCCQGIEHCWNGNNPWPSLRYLYITRCATTAFLQLLIERKFIGMFAWIQLTSYLKHLQLNSSKDYNSITLILRYVHQSATKLQFISLLRN